MEKDLNLLTDTSTLPEKLSINNNTKGSINLNTLKNPILYTLNKAEYSVSEKESLPILVQELCRCFLYQVGNEENQSDQVLTEDKKLKICENNLETGRPSEYPKANDSVDTIFDPPRGGLKLNVRQCQKLGSTLVGMIRQENQESISKECKILEKKLIDYNYQITKVKSYEKKLNDKIKKLEVCRDMLLYDIRNARKKQELYFEDSKQTSFGDSETVEIL
ncbi:hypothetical protein SteCoe_36179 [Stentor coeruleus]|uniref:Uncharacterized protein n=1 Tax=Stentor coeruleus TaxID=5963 RepID=A0A1R2AQP9_9CILI|nr:hypothetical protein SteCoe_36179 [Stentor coeruleus]